MRDHVPNFQPFPYARLPRIGRREAAHVSLAARWLRAASRTGTAKLAALFGGPVELRVVGAATAPFDPLAAFAEVRSGAAAFAVAGSSSGIRALAQRLLGGPAELAAPRPLTPAERAIFALAVAAALADAGIAAEAWPLDAAPAWIARGEASPHGATIAAHGAARRARDADAEAANRRGAVDAGAAARRSDDADANRGGAAAEDVAHAPTRLGAPDAAHAATRFAPDAATRFAPPAASGGGAIELSLVGPGAGISLAVVVHVPPGLELRVPPPAPAAWSLDCPVVVAACALPRAAAARLAVRDVIVVERALQLRLGDGAVGLAADPEAVEARVATGYVARPMIADDAHLELTVQLGTARLSMRRISELAVGEVIPLGRPLAGPYEIHANGHLIGQGELIDVDGELGVRIVSMHFPDRVQE